MNKLFMSFYVAVALAASPVIAQAADLAGSASAPSPAPTKTEWTLKEVQADTEKAFREQDLNQDGVVDAVDRAIARQQKLDARFSELDTNKDGNISKVEWDQGDASKRAGEDRASVTLEGLLSQNRDDFNKLDLNRDGTLTVAERTEAFAAMAKQRGGE